MVEMIDGEHWTYLEDASCAECGQLTVWRHDSEQVCINCRDVGNGRLSRIQEAGVGAPEDVVPAAAS